MPSNVMVDIHTLISMFDDIGPWNVAYATASSNKPVFVHLHANRICAQALGDEKTVADKVKAVLKQHYEMLLRAFTFYSCGGSSDAFHLGLNQFTSFVEDCKVCTVHNCPHGCISRFQFRGAGNPSMRRHRYASSPWSLQELHVCPTNSRLVCDSHFHSFNVFY